MDTWGRIEQGRVAFAEYLATLSSEDWAHASLCAGWSVKDVAAHMLVIPTIPKGKVFRTFLGSGFNLDKMNTKFVRQISTQSGAEIAAATKASAGSRSVPPGLHVEGVHNELVVHSADIAVALRKPFALLAEDQQLALAHLMATQPVFKSKARVAGLTLRATDADWSAGSGPLVEGPIQQLLLAVAGRPSAYDVLSGDGVATMRSR